MRAAMENIFVAECTGIFSSPRTLGEPGNKATTCTI